MFKNFQAQIKQAQEQVSNAQAEYNIRVGVTRIAHTGIVYI
jgi:hypothetical protein